MINELTIGTLAKLSRVNVETIRYYQLRNLLHEPPKPLAGYRQYPSDTSGAFASSSGRRHSVSRWKRSAGCSASTNEPPAWRHKA